MSTLRVFSTTVLMFFLLLPATYASEVNTASETSTQWPGYRGPETPPTNVFPEGSFGLVEVWQRPLGSGYSSFAIAGEHLVTQFTDGEDDVLAAFRSRDGEEIWRYRVADKYAGHHGSDDGPLATPAIAGDRVIAVGAMGQVVAVALANGSELWKVQLDESNSTTPFYGYTASPLIVDDLVILATGGEGHAITAFDLSTGDVRWRYGDDSVTYQTPILTELAGRRQVVAVTDHWVYGLEPSDGSMLWSYRHTEDQGSEQSTHPTVTDAQHVLLNLDEGSLMLKISETNGTFTSEEVWRNRAFASSLVLPVAHEGLVFGFSGRILTCVDASTGEILWRSRGVASFNLSLVDGHLVTVSRPDGDVVVVKANREEYEEKARLAVFEIGDYANAAYADGLFFIRNLSHMTALRVDRQADAGVIDATEDPHRIRGAMGELVTELLGMPEAERQARAESWLENKTLPLVEVDSAGAGLAHFVYQGEAEDVAVSGNFPDQNRVDLTMHRVPGTDLFYRTLELDPAGQWRYRLSIDFARGGQDPANPLPAIDERFALFSELRMPEWTASPYIEDLPDDAPRGSLDTFQFASEILENTRQIQVWMPPGYGGDTSYPVVVVNHGDRALRAGRMATVLDNVVGKTAEPLLVVFVPRASAPEYRGELTGAYTRFLTDELMPHIDRHYQTQTEGRTVFGTGSAGAAAVYAALHAPETFPRAVVQSFYVNDSLRNVLEERLNSANPKPEHIYVEWSRYDYDQPGDDIDAAADAKALLEKLRAHDIKTTEDIVTGAAGWGSWRAQTHRWLEAFFPNEG